MSSYCIYIIRYPVKVNNNENKTTSVPSTCDVHLKEYQSSFITDVICCCMSQKSS